MKALSLAAMCGIAIASVAASAAPRAVTPVARDMNPEDGWMKRHNAKLEEASKGGAKVVFIGDSITHNWESNGREQLKRYYSSGDMKMLNLGTSADRTEHVLWRLGHGELDGYEARCVVLMIGTNNAGQKSVAEQPPADVILGIREILKVIRGKQPKAKVVLCAIFPRGADANDPVRLRNDVVNRELPKLCDGKDVFWCDFTDQMMTADGLLPRDLFPDLLHPGPQGYEIWHAAVKPYIDYALSDGNLPVPPNRYSSHVVRTGARAGVPTAATPATRIRSEGYGRFDWWLDRLLSKRTQISESRGKIDLVFFGDSITHNWEERQGRAALDELMKTYSILDIGYSGDRTEHLLWRGENGELDGYEAKCIMLMIGTNNRQDKPEDIASGVRAILDMIARKQPNATTLLLPIFPCGVNPQDRPRVRNGKANEIIRTFADGKKVILVDFGDKFIDANGDVKWIMPDRLHPSEEGYRIWTEAVLPHFKKICGK